MPRDSLCSRSLGGAWLPRLAFQRLTWLVFDEAHKTDESRKKRHHRQIHSPVTMTTALLKACEEASGRALSLWTSGGVKLENKKEDNLHELL